RLCFLTFDPGTLQSTRFAAFFQSSARSEARRHPGRAGHQIRSHHQPHHCQGAWPDYPGVVSTPRRRSNRMIRRRELITLLGGTAAWPLAARAQQPERVRRIGVLMNVPADTQWGQAYIVAFREALSKLGWSDGGNLRIDVRWGENVIERDRKYATEL